jgi:DNA-directed RNA polymerase specialized sigma24 family protein
MAETAVIVAEQEERPFDARMLRVMMGVAAYHARKVARTMGLGDAEREDVEQDILLALLERRRFFDPARGAWSSFAELVARQAAQLVADDIGADRRVQAGSLDASPENGDIVSDLRAAVESKMTSTPDHELPLSVARFVADLPEELAMVAKAALEEDGDIADAQRNSGLSSSEFYRRLREVRVRLICLELVLNRPF